MNNTNNASARESYQIAKRLLWNAMRNKFIGKSATDVAPATVMGDDDLCTKWVESRKNSQGTIRLEVELNTQNNTFNFGVTPNQANSSNIQYGTEQRLNLQDTFVVSEYAIYVGKPASQNDTQWYLRTYGNTVDFTAAAALALDTTFYHNGSFQMKCDNDVIIPYRGLVNHYYRGQTQQTAALGANSPGDQFRGAEDGYITDEPNILLIGSKNYVPSIELKSSLASVDAGTRAVVIFSGILMQNSTIVN